MAQTPSTRDVISATVTTRTLLPCKSLVHLTVHWKYADKTSYDVTDKKASKVISRTSYEGASYTHQGWVLDTKWQEWLIMDDEFDEEEFAGPAADGYPVTYICEWHPSAYQKPY